jgi:uncharacterized protein (TIGR00255 family)
MTGHGEAHRRHNQVSIGVEVRTINSRYFKLSLRTIDPYSSLEPQIEAAVRDRIRRGTLQVALRIDREPSAEDFLISDVVLASYYEQLRKLNQSLKVTEPIRLDGLLQLPGVVVDRATQRQDVETDWPEVQAVLLEALDNLQKMRIEEGRAMEVDLTANCAVIAAALDQITLRAPQVVEAYRARLADRLNKLLTEYELTIAPSDIVREVGLFAERSDISEEIVRLKSHLEQFDMIMKNEDACGRKLEFVTQEMFRETNTMGSKANDPEISRHVIEIKSAIERMREMIQNVE